MVKWLTKLFAGAAFAAVSVSAQEKPLVVGTELLFPPFEMLDAKGQPAGVSIDMMNAFGEFIHQPVQIQNIPFDGLIPSLKTGKVDLVISSMTVTEDRKKSIDFSDPYLKMGLSILVKKDSDIQSVNDLDKPEHHIVVKKGTTGHIYATQHFKSAKILVLNDSSSCAAEVSQGKADAFIYDQVSVYQHWKKYEETTRAILQPFQEEEWAIGVRKGNDELRQKINAFIKQFKESGGFSKLGDKFFADSKKTFAELGIPFYF
jgi:polar amino acid transport system substrate-binding protein